MDFSNWLVDATSRLVDAGIDTARLDALIIAEDILLKNRSNLLANPDMSLTIAQQAKLFKAIARRVKHEPLAYIRGKTEFYGREFYVNDSVLEPRPESENIINLLKSCFPGSDPGKQVEVVDVGAGSGVLAITAKLEIPNTMVTAIDIDEECLKIAQINADKHKVNIEIKQGNLVEPLLNARPYPDTSGQLLIAGKISQPSSCIIMANLPYVPDNYQINSAAKHEPKLAIFGGKDGLDLYRTMFIQLAEYAKDEVFVLTESLPFQHPELLNIAVTHNYTQIVEEDFIQVFKKYQ